jgi:hypothetical protein
MLVSLTLGLYHTLVSKVGLLAAYHAQADRA